jgi:hypothetical protein
MERMRLLVAGIFLSLVRLISCLIRFAALFLLTLSQLTIANARSSLRVRDVVVPTNLPADWEYKGCFTSVVALFVASHTDLMVAKALVVVL